LFNRHIITFARNVSPLQPHNSETSMPLFDCVVNHVLVQACLFINDIRCHNSSIVYFRFSGCKLAAT